MNYNAQYYIDQTHRQELLREAQNARLAEQAGRKSTEQKPEKSAKGNGFAQLMKLVSESR